MLSKGLGIGKNLFEFGGGSESAVAPLPAGDLSGRSSTGMDEGTQVVLGQVESDSPGWSVK